MESKELAESMSVWPGGETELHPMLISSVGIAEPLLYLIAAAVFVAAAIFLVTKTKTPGRFLILSGILLVGAPLSFELWRSSSLVIPTADSIAVIKLIVSSAALLCALGFGRMALHLRSTSRDQ
jgi:hypothetical protein